MTMVMGYSEREWQQMYKFYIFCKKSEPETLFDVKNCWETTPHRTPEECFRVASIYSEAENAIGNCSLISGMLVRFLGR